MRAVDTSWYVQWPPADCPVFHHQSIRSLHASHLYHYMSTHAVWFSVTAHCIVEPARPEVVVCGGRCDTARD